MYIDEGTNKLFKKTNQQANELHTVDTLSTKGFLGAC
jgi:hypothetical protein